MQWDLTDLGLPRTVRDADDILLTVLLPHNHLVENNSVSPLMYLKTCLSLGSRPLLLMRRRSGFLSPDSRIQFVN